MGGPFMLLCEEQFDATMLRCDELAGRDASLIAAKQLGFARASIKMDMRSRMTG
jgi:hypothetical protein